MTAGVYQN